MGDEARPGPPADARARGSRSHARPSVTLTKPMHPPPHSAMPASRRSCASRCAQSCASGDRRSTPQPNTTADRSPRAGGRASAVSSSAASATPSSTRSTGPSRRVSEASRQGRPSDLVVARVDEMDAVAVGLRVTSRHQALRRSCPAARWPRRPRPSAPRAWPARRARHRWRPGRSGSAATGSRVALALPVGDRRRAACQPGMPHTPPPAWVAGAARCRARRSACGSRRSRAPAACGTAARATARRGRCCRRSGRTRAPSRTARRRRGAGSTP